MHVREDAELERLLDRFEERLRVRSGPRLLRGWKAIAEHLGVSERTAQRWHRDYGMPVIRILAKRCCIHTAVLVEWWIRLDRGQRKFLAELPDGTPPRPVRELWRRRMELH